MLSERQKKADAIARELRLAFGDDAAVINPMPLDPDQQLRIQVLDSKRDAFIEKMCGWGWLPAFYCVQYRVSTGNYGLIPASVFEIKIEEERQPIPDRKIYGEVAERKKTATEVEVVRKHLGLR
jgi:hypothetical protein